MKLLSIIHTTQPGGVQRVAVMETVWLNKLGYNALIASIVRTKKWNLFDKFRVSPIYLSKNEVLGRALPSLLLGPISSINPDIVIAHNNPAFQVALKLKQRVKKHFPIVFYLHDSLAYPVSGSVFGEISKIFPHLLKKMEFKHIKESKIVLVNSRVTLNKVAKNNNLDSVSREKIKVLYPTINIPISKERITKEKQKYLLIVGRIDHEAFFNLYKIMKIMKKGKDIDIPLVIAGYGHPRNPIFFKILRLFKSLGKKDKVYFMLSPSDRQLLELYRNASLFVYPGHENFNMSALEAMSAGCPILVADTSGICEILPQKLREELCLPKDNVDVWIKRIQEISEDSKIYQRGIECWKITQKYNICTHMEELSKVLEELT